MKCKNCNNELPEGSLFCNFCGVEQVTEEKTESPISVDKGKSKRKILIIVVVVAVIALIVGAIVYYQTSQLSYEEKTAVRNLEDYKKMLKDPDSMKLRSDVVVIRAYDYEDEVRTYCFFTSSGSNSFGASVQSTAFYRGLSYICDMSSADESDFEDIEDKQIFLDGKLKLMHYKLYGKDAEIFIKCEVVPAKKVAKRVKIDYEEN